MAQGKAITVEQVETIKAAYAESGCLRTAARAASVSVATAKKYADNRDEFEQLRTEKRVDIIAKIADVQVKLLDSMVDPDALKKATLQEKAVSFGIVSDKGLLMTGQATSRNETIEPTRLTPEQMEQAAAIRERFANQAKAVT